VREKPRRKQVKLLKFARKIFVRNSSPEVPKRRV
jgi:hypothetical protein